MTPIPYGELDAVAGQTRRTLVLRVLVAAAAVGAAAAVVLLGRGEAAPPSPLPAGTDGLVVLDLSASISTDTYARIGATLDELADTGGRYGLIVFSDTAYVALPPGTPAAELRAFARRFDLPEQAGGAIVVPTSPWTDAFSAGTKISTGLQLALDTIKAKRLGRPAVLLVSDLDDDVGDLERLTGTALAFRRLEIPVRVIGLNAAPEDERYIKRLLRRSSDLSAASLPGDERTGGWTCGCRCSWRLSRPPPRWRSGSSSSLGWSAHEAVAALARAVALAAAVVLTAALVMRARAGDEEARLRAAVAAYEAAAVAGRGFDSGVTRTNLRSRAQALLTEIAVAEDRMSAAKADVLLGVLAAGGGRSAAGQTPDELSPRPLRDRRPARQRQRRGEVRPRARGAAAARDRDPYRVRAGLGPARRRPARRRSRPSRTGLLTCSPSS